MRPSSTRSSEPARSPRELRRFGLILTAGFAIVGGISWWRGHTVPPAVLWSLAALVGTAALVVPRALGPVERWWLRVGLVLAWVNTRIILTVLFYVVLTPIALVMRLFRDPLDRRRSAEAPSYWHRRTPRPDGAAAGYEQQF